MLFRINTTARLDEIAGQLRRWTADAEEFRIAARAARQGMAPAAALVDAAEAVQSGLEDLLAEIELALDQLPPGHRDYGALLQAHTIAGNLAESVGNSLYALAEMAPVDTELPVHIVHSFLAAE